MSLWPPRMKRMEVIQHQNLSQAHICRTWRNGLWRYALDVYPGTRTWRFLLNSIWNSLVAAQHTTKAGSNKGLPPTRRSVRLLEICRSTHVSMLKIFRQAIYIYFRKNLQKYTFTLGITRHGCMRSGPPLRRWWWSTSCAHQDLAVFRWRLQTLISTDGDLIDDATNNSPIPTIPRPAIHIHQMKPGRWNLHTIRTNKYHLSISRVEFPVLPIIRRWSCRDEHVLLSCLFLGVCFCCLVFAS